MFGWFQGRPKSNLPEPTALQTQRAKQIEQLRSFNQNVSEIQRDVEYRVNTIVNGTTISLYITLPPQFPQDKPMVKVSPPLSHPWVNDQMIVTGCIGINNFLVHSDLGRVIKDIVEEFQSNPPNFNPSGFRVGNYPGYPMNAAMPQPPAIPARNYPATQSQAYPTGPSKSTGSASTGGFMPMPTLPNTKSANAQSDIFGPSAYPNQRPLAGMPGAYTMPDIPNAFPQLAEMSVSELRDLSENEEKLLEMLGNMPQIQQLSKDRENFCLENEKIASTNLEMKPVLEGKKRELLEKYDQLNDLRSRFDSLSRKQDDLLQQYDISVIQDRLKIAASQAEEQAENMAEQFLEGNLTVDEFKKKYLNKRTEGNMRRAKEEKILPTSVYS